jgi:hypothetical protein
VANASKRHKGCALCKPHQWRGQGPARKLPGRDLRRLGIKRRFPARVLTERQWRDWD